MVKFKVPLKDILGRAYYQYELSSSNYNPHIDETITITCTCKNVLGNPIANKTLELMMNDISHGTSITNANGIATWSITFKGWGNKHFYIGNATLDLVVTGWRQIAKYSSDRITLCSDGKWGMVAISGTWSNSTTGEVVLATINSGYSPFSNVSTNYSYSVGSYQPVYTRGTNICINRSGTGNYGAYCTLYFRLANQKY